MNTQQLQFYKEMQRQSMLRNYHGLMNGGSYGMVVGEPIILGGEGGLQDGNHDQLGGSDDTFNPSDYKWLFNVWQGDELLTETTYTFLYDPDDQSWKGAETTSVILKIENSKYIVMDGGTKITTNQNNSSESFSVTTDDGYTYMFERREANPAVPV